MCCSPFSAEGRIWLLPPRMLMMVLTLWPWRIFFMTGPYFSGKSSRSSSRTAWRLVFVQPFTKSCALAICCMYTASRLSETCSIRSQTSEVVCSLMRVRNSSNVSSLSSSLNFLFKGNAIFALISSFLPAPCPRAFLLPRRKAVQNCRFKIHNPVTDLRVPQTHICE